MKIVRINRKARGGIHPQYRKDITRDKAIVEMPAPKLLNVSMSQHMGAPAKPAVKKGDAVLKGQVIGEAAGFISASVHSPVSGTVKSLAPCPTASGMTAVSIEIESDGDDRWSPDIMPHADYANMSSKELVSIVASAGLAGMGGAGFPTHVKLSPPADKKIDTLIINGAECEPFLTADHRLMIEHAGEIWAGCEIIRRILGADTVWIAIEDNKPEAVSAMEKAMANADDKASIAVLKSQYPQGAEKQLIYAITGREVPSGGLPMDVAAVVENVGTTMAVRDAVLNGRPLVERIVTVTGPQVNSPGNLRTRIGVSYADMIAFCGGINGIAGKIISGGPMMGLAQHTLDVTVTKTTSGILALPPEMVKEYSSMPCISCGRCVEACPTYLVPCELSQMIESEDYESAETWNVMDCIECGCCAYVCPAHRPMVQHMRRGKAWVTAKRRAAREAGK